MLFSFFFRKSRNSLVVRGGGTPIRSIPYTSVVRAGHVVAGVIVVAVVLAIVTARERRVLH